jgi:hypothetical protein
VGRRSLQYRADGLVSGLLQLRDGQTRAGYVGEAGDGHVGQLPPRLGGAILRVGGADRLVEPILAFAEIPHR